MPSPKPRKGRATQDHGARGPGTTAGRPADATPARLATETDPQEFRVRGRPLVCALCGSKLFWTRTGVLDRAGSSLIGWEWADRGALNVICADCGHILWFVER